MDGLIRRAAVAAGAAVVVLGLTTGTASATQEATLAFAPSPYDYGQVTPGHTATQTFTLANTGGKASGALTITVPGSAAFTITADTCPGSLGPGKSCTVTVQFAPAGAGTASATLTATNNKSTVLATDSLAGAGVVPGHLYWGDDGDLMTANLDGSGVTTLVSGLNSPIAVDSNHIYWGTGGDLMAANLDGSGVTTLLSGLNDVDAIAVGNGRIYWTEGCCNSGTGTIMAANLDGSGVTTLLSGLDNANGIAVDSSHIYWTGTTFPDGTIMAANLDGSGVTTLVSGLDNPQMTAVDSNHIYWAEKGPYIKEANLDGSGVTILVSGEQAAAGFPEGVAVDSSHIYWTTFDLVDGTVREANLDGTGVTTLVSGENADMGGIAVGP